MFKSDTQTVWPGSSCKLSVQLGGQRYDAPVTLRPVVLTLTEQQRRRQGECNKEVNLQCSMMNDSFNAQFPHYYTCTANVLALYAVVYSDNKGLRRQHLKVS